MNYIKIFQNTQDLSVSVEKNYPEDQLIHIFLDNFYQGGKYSSQIDRHQEELIREEKFTDQKYVSISYLQTDYINLVSSSDCGKIVIDQILSRQSALFLEGPTILHKNVSKES